MIFGSSLFRMGNGVDCLASVMISDDRWTAFKMPSVNTEVRHHVEDIKFPFTEAFAGVFEKLLNRDRSEAA